MPSEITPHPPGALRVILSVSGGVADVVYEPKGIEVIVFDYDVDGTKEDDPRIAKDPDGQACCILQWPSSEKIVENRHWPIDSLTTGFCQVTSEDHTASPT